MYNSLDCETAVMHKLQSHILEYADLLLSVVECTAELDWYIIILPTVTVDMCIKYSTVKFLDTQPRVMLPCIV